MKVLRRYPFLVLFPGIPLAMGVVATVIFGAVQLITALEWAPGYFLLLGIAGAAAPGAIFIIFYGVKVFSSLRNADDGPDETPQRRYALSHLALGISRQLGGRVFH